MKNINHAPCSKSLVSRLTAYSAMAGAVLACMPAAEGKIVDTVASNTSTGSVSISDLIPQNQQVQGQIARHERQIGFRVMSSGSHCSNPPPPSSGE
jgi:hypothetical protein